MAGGGAAAGGPNMGAITSQMGFQNAGFTGIHELVFGRLKPDIGWKLDTFNNWMMSMIPHKNSFFAKRLFSLNSKSKGMSVQQLAPDAKWKGFFSQGQGF